jgi:hypothetical protein
MKLSKNAGRSVGLLASIATFAAPAMAYIDPGAGSIAIQLLIAAVLAGAFKLRTLMSAFKSCVARLFGKSESRADSNSSKPGDQ